MRFHYATHKDMQFKTYKLFISGIFHLIFFDYVCLWKQTADSKITDKGGLLYRNYEDRKIFLISFFCSFIYEKVGLVN